MEKINEALEATDKIQRVQKAISTFYDKFRSGYGEHMNQLQISELLSIKEKMDPEPAATLARILKHVPEELMKEAKKLRDARKKRGKIAQKRRKERIMPLKKVSKDFSKKLGEILKKKQEEKQTLDESRKEDEEEPIDAKQSREEMIENFKKTKKDFTEENIGKEKLKQFLTKRLEEIAGEEEKLKKRVPILVDGLLKKDGDRLRGQNNLVDEDRDAIRHLIGGTGQDVEEDFKKVSKKTDFNWLEKILLNGYYSLWVPKRKLTEEEKDERKKDLELRNDIESSFDKKK